MSKWWRRVALAGAVGSFGGCLFSCGLGFGILFDTEQRYREQFHEERELIEPVLASDPAFADFRCRLRSNGGVRIEGTVATRADRDRLRERLTPVVGGRRAGEIASSASGPR